MAAFPAIEPISRRYGLGAHPMAIAGFSSLDEVRFLQGGTLSGVSMALEFRAISTSEATQIRDHYLGQREHRSFTLPAALWRTHSSQFNVAPATNVWRYAGQPQESPRSGGLVDVSVSLASALLPTLAPGTTGPPTAPSPMLAFTGGTSLAWSEDRTYGYSITLATAKQIKGVGVYDAGGDGLQDAISVFVGINLGGYLPYGSDVITIDPGQQDFEGQYIVVPAGTAAPLDGAWRKVSFEGVTLQPGTYGVLAFLTFATTSSYTMIKNATGLTTQDSITVNGPLAYDHYTEEAVSTTGDNPAYFGPVLFF